MKVRLPSSFGNIQEKMKKMQEELELLDQKEYEGSSGGEIVRVKVLGDFSISDIKISDEAYEDKDMLPDLILAACNNALDKAKKEKDEISKSVTSGFDIPGLV